MFRTTLCVVFSFALPLRIMRNTVSDGPERSAQVLTATEIPETQSLHSGGPSEAFQQTKSEDFCGCSGKDQDEQNQGLFFLSLVSVNQQKGG